MVDNYEIGPTGSPDQDKLTAAKYALSADLTVISAVSLQAMAECAMHCIHCLLSMDSACLSGGLKRRTKSSI